MSDVYRQIADIEANTFSHPWSFDDIADSLGREYNHGIVILSDGAIQDIRSVVSGSVAGYILYSVVAGEAELLRIAISVDNRNKGYADKLMRYFIEALQSCCESCFLEVRQSNNVARHLYEKNDFVMIGTRKGYYKEPVCDACIYQRAF